MTQHGHGVYVILTTRSSCGTDWKAIAYHPLVANKECAGAGMKCKSSQHQEEEVQAWYDHANGRSVADKLATLKALAAVLTATIQFLLNKLVECDPLTSRELGSNLCVIYTVYAT